MKAGLEVSQKKYDSPANLSIDDPGCAGSAPAAGLRVARLFAMLWAPHRQVQIEVAENMESTENREDRVQLHLVLPYKFEPRQDRRVRSYLDRGYRIRQLQRISDREVLITLSAATGFAPA
jgi:hypothetical protein